MEMILFTTGIAETLSYSCTLSYKYLFQKQFTHKFGLAFFIDSLDFSFTHFYEKNYYIDQKQKIIEKIYKNF